VYDVIVVGAGPAGSSCAARASELGLSVLLLERAEFPRPKPCAAGLTERALEMLGGKIDTAVHRRVQIVEIACGGARLLAFAADHPLIATTTRRELDSLLMSLAGQEGAAVEQGVSVESVEQDGEQVRVTGSGRSWTGRNVVVADGSRGVLRERLGLDAPRFGGGAYVRLFPDATAELEPFADRVLFDPSVTARGYGWIFPKSDHLNVGVFRQRPLRSGIVSVLDSFVGEMGVASWRADGPFAFPIPLGRPPGAVSSGRVLVAGDAAGLADPITGEGISHAIESGRAAAEAVAEAERSGREPDGQVRDTAASIYERVVAREIVPRVNALRLRGSVLYLLGPGFARASARARPLRALAAALLGTSAAVREGRVSLLTESPSGRRDIEEGSQ
jgi:geranylgeranyl reductase family protein